MRRRHREDEDTNIDMTPMLDIVFIMLIFFIVTTSFIKEEGIGLKRPSNTPPNQEKTEDPPKVVTITINHENQISMDDRIIDSERIGANIEAKLAEDPRSPVLIRVHNDALNNSLLSAVDQARAAGVDEKKITVARMTN
ncbi:biopolymer transporter ExbD [Kangiella sp. HZ709]|uniref:ExbD/TolR family protein n=1 Tax=Kangiella sp. HZ709 TaxID=2666328 RepID=UPI0012AF312B|nr:biopolymer transporter ExbD [Kangiella sp. HZ709]MRX27630.1 biopolymer transporter ExbD [Kangiella sp. HZ709]